MKKITIYTTTSSRPDFIPVQYESFKTFMRDEYEYVVLNNAIDSKKMRDAISRTCRELGVRCIEIKRNPAFDIIGGQKALTFYGSYTNPNVALPYALRQHWEDMCEDNKDDMFVIIDSDMFLCRAVSFNEELGEADAAVILQYRGLLEHATNASVTYPWNGICIFNPEKIPHLKEMNWDCGVTKSSFINGHPVDVGGYIHFWLKQHSINIKHISEYAIYNFKKRSNTRIWLEAVLNGNFHYSFEYDTESRDIFDFHSYEKNWSPGDKLVPHFPLGFETILKEKTIQYFEKFVLDKQSYPQPTFLGCIEFETFAKDIDPFIVHNKAGSGYLGFDKDYGTQKLAFIEKTIGVDRAKISGFRKRIDINTLFEPMVILRDYKKVIKRILRKIKQRMGEHTN